MFQPRSPLVVVAIMGPREALEVWLVLGEGRLRRSLTERPRVSVERRPTPDDEVQALPRGQHISPVREQPCMDHSPAKDMLVLNTDDAPINRA